MTMPQYILYPVSKLGVQQILKEEDVKVQTAFKHLRIVFNDKLV